MEPVGAIATRVNYGLAPRSRSCWVCTNVGMPEDVTFRLLDEEGAEQPLDDAIDYLTACGHTASKRVWRGRLTRHRDHVQRAMARGVTVITPAHVEQGRVSKVPAGSPTWLRTTDKAIDLGDEALDVLRERMEGMETADLVAVARLGQTAAGKRGDWEAKGRQLGQMDTLMRLAYGAGRSNDR